KLSWLLDGATRDRPQCHCRIDNNDFEALEVFFSVTTYPV
nr:hypothetical protein [Tanacetum cinerariifolium]